MKFNIETLTRDEVVQLIRSGNDEYSNQIRVTVEGDVYLSRTVGFKDTDELLFRFETFAEGNGFVGEAAAEDDDYITKLYNGLMKCWKSKERGYIDYWELL